MNPKLQKVNRDIERTKAKISELQAALPGLERQRSELENNEVIKAFRAADVAPADFTAFIDAYMKSLNGTEPPPASPSPQYINMEDLNDEE